MKQFEYYISDTDNIEHIDQLGLEGWELVSVDSGIAYFKRQIQ